MTHVQQCCTCVFLLVTDYDDDRQAFPVNWKEVRVLFTQEKDL